MSAASFRNLDDHLTAVLMRAGLACEMDGIALEENRVKATMDFAKLLAVAAQNDPAITAALKSGFLAEIRALAVDYSKKGLPQ